MTAERRMREAEAVVKEQRSDHVGTEVVLRPHPDGETEYVEEDDWRDLLFELHRLQQTVMGET
jgi:hypothetical protein